MRDVPRSFRPSEYLGAREVSNLLHAPRLAAVTGEPINVMLTINLHMMGRNSARIEPIASAICERFRKWVTRPGRRSPGPKVAAANYYWSAENPESVPNLHISMHVPPCRMEAFHRASRRWVVAVLGAILDENAVHTGPLDFAPGNAEYLAKGASPPVARAFNLKHEPQGWIIGTRSRTSRALGPKAKKTLREQGKYGGVR